MKKRFQRNAQGLGHIARTVAVLAIALACLSPGAGQAVPAIARALAGAGLFIDSGQRLGAAVSRGLAAAASVQQGDVGIEAWVLRVWS